MIKKVFGRPVFDYQDNISRNQFNEMLRKEYEGKEPFFDLANIESTFPHGKRASFAKNGSIYYSMVPEYTDDGGHLNKVGRRRITGQLLVFLANLSD